MGWILVLLDCSGSTSPIDGAGNELLNVDQDRRAVLDRAGEAEEETAHRMQSISASFSACDFGRTWRALIRLH
jgi:hypothetical protein